eukprot:TRINITY_DN11856_c0_g1_i1.p1 TRINITY_DN11856_c0_g1~~TRINITY_DN11856_c0_g1_i1.p1  ORF type:complete len:250 (+),score=63.87 TRINITY_DN11856_c0_g1_i1:81-830(+)
MSAQLVQRLTSTARSTVVAFNKVQPIPRKTFMADRKELCGAKILAINGSLRNQSFNKHLLDRAVSAARATGADVEFFDLKAKPLPFYDQDIEEEKGLAFDNVGLLRQKVLEADGILLAVAEYNSSLTAVLKNAIDWASRPPNSWDNKVVAMVGGAPGIYATVRVQNHLRVVFAGINAKLLPQAATIPFVHKAVSATGDVLDASAQNALDQVGKALVEAARAQKLVKYVHNNTQEVLGFKFHDGSLQTAL